VISEEEVDKALHWLIDTASECAEKRAHRLYLDEFTRSLRSQIMSEHLAETLGAQERFALSDIRYRNHLEALKIAIFRDENARFLREAAVIKLDVYRTQCANHRGKI